MPIPWIAALKIIPWGDVIEHAPKVLNAARKLLDKQKAPAGPPAAPVRGRRVNFWGRRGAGGSRRAGAARPASAAVVPAGAPPVPPVVIEGHAVGRFGQGFVLVLGLTGQALAFDLVGVRQLLTALRAKGQKDQKARARLRFAIV